MMLQVYRVVFPRFIEVRLVRGLTVPSECTCRCLLFKVPTEIRADLMSLGNAAVGQVKAVGQRSRGVISAFLCVIVIVLLLCLTHS